jgi:hypothetical protein
VSRSFAIYIIPFYNSPLTRVSRSKFKGGENFVTPTNWSRL